MYNTYLYTLLFILIINNPISYKQMINISIFNTGNNLNIFAYIFKSLLVTIIYFIAKYLNFI